MNIVTIVGIIHPIVISFVIGTGFGWCLCSLVDFIRKYLEMKRDQKKSERTWAELRPYLEHRRIQVGDTVEWVRNNEAIRRKQNGLHDKQIRRDTEETSGTS